MRPQNGIHILYTLLPRFRDHWERGGGKKSSGKGGGWPQESISSQWLVTSYMKLMQCKPDWIPSWLGELATKTHPSAASIGSSWLLEQENSFFLCKYNTCEVDHATVIRKAQRLGQHKFALMRKRKSWVRRKGVDLGKLGRKD